MTRNEWLRRFSFKVNQLMHRKGLSQRKLSALSGISQPTINNYVQGLTIPKFEHLLKLAYALDASLEELADFGEVIDRV